MLAGRSVRTYLTLLLLVAMLPLAAVLGYDVYVRAAADERQLALAAFHAAQRTADNTARFVAESEALIAKIAASAGKYLRHPSLCSELTTLYAGLPPIYANITVSNSAGQLLCSARETDPKKLPYFGNREYIKRLFRENRPAISPPLVGLISRRWSVFFAHPIRDEEGLVIGVAILAVDLLGLQFVARDRSALPGTITRIFDRAGTVVTSSDRPAEWVGRNVRNTEAVNIALDRKEGTVSAMGLGRAVHMHGFAPVSGTDWIAYSSIPAGPVYSESTRRALAYFMVSLIVIAVVGALLYLVAQAIVRPILHIASVADQVSAGRKHIRASTAGPAEVARVADQVNRMLDRQREVELELRAGEQRMRLLSTKLLRVQEDERKKLARDLHDQVGQVLAALAMKLGVVRHQCATTPAMESIDECLNISDRLNRDVRALTLELRPPQLDELGLTGALRAYAERFAQSSQMSCRFIAPDMLPAIPSIVEVSCFRIAQEALANALRHSGGTSIWMELALAGDALHLTVRDNGSGFDTGAAREQAVRGDSSGLISMEERALLVGGRVDIAATAGVGTEIHAVFPIRPQDQPSASAGSV